MAKDKVKKENPIASFGGLEIELTKFNLLKDKEQYEKINQTLNEIYGDNLKVTKRHVMKVINLTLNPKDDYIFLPYNLKVSKERLLLKFYIEKEKGIAPGLIIFFIWAFIFSVVCATYAGIRFLSLMDLNKDIDGDGIADINVDINNDEIAEINIDTNGDDKPNINIDYKGNRMSVFNIDLDNDGKPDSNLVVDATDPNKKCYLNCDVNGDGWPDRNLDIDGDGKADFDIDTDGDNVADLNLDLNGDYVCDVMCDDNKDGIADTNLIPSLDNLNGKGTGTTVITGNGGINVNTEQLVVNFIDGETVDIYGLMPTDQNSVDPEYVDLHPYKTFTVENLSSYSMTYRIRMNVKTNTFTSDHFQYKISATNGGPNIDWRVAPKQTIYKTEGYITDGVIKIRGKVSQKFTVDYRLLGINEPQNYDQGQSFKANFEIELVDVLLDERAN